MDTAMYQAAGGGRAFGYILLLVGGFALAIGLAWAVWVGMRVRRRESPPPRPEEQPKLPPTGPVRETQEIREPHEVPRAADGSERLTPHQLGNVGTRPAEDQSRPRWSPGSSGSFGGGGGGRT
ncbi:DUF6479 family protein [Streptomyces bungoensis]|nr:DUF6479 family protein [Streptomyces bungoensis]